MSRPGAGWPIGEIAAHLGHSIEVCSRIYLHVFNEPSRYRGIPIEQVITDAKDAALVALPGTRVSDFHSKRLRDVYGGQNEC